MYSKRDEIIKLAAELIHSKGYENTKLSDILEATQTGKGQFYHYFSSKRELGLAVLDYFFERWNRRLLDGILSSEKDPKVKFDEMLEWIIKQHEKNCAKVGCAFGNLAIEMSEHDEEFRRKLHAVFEVWESKLEAVIAAMIAPANVDPAELKRLAQGIVALVEGGILLMKSKQDINVLVNVTKLARFIVEDFVLKHNGEN